MSVNGGNNRFAALLDRVDPFLEGQDFAVQVSTLVRAAADHHCRSGRQVGTGREAFARGLDHHHSDVAIVGQILEVSREDREKIEIHGVVLLRPVESQPGDSTFIFDNKRLGRLHRSFPRAGKTITASIGKPVVGVKPAGIF